MEPLKTTSSLFRLDVLEQAITWLDRKSSISAKEILSLAKSTYSNDPNAVEQMNTLINVHPDQKPQLDYDDFARILVNPARYLAPTDKEGGATLLLKAFGFPDPLPKGIKLTPTLVHSNEGTRRAAQIFTAIVEPAGGPKAGLPIIPIFAGLELGTPAYAPLAIKLAAKGYKVIIATLPTMAGSAFDQPTATYIHDHNDACLAVITQLVSRGSKIRTLGHSLGSGAQQAPSEQERLSHELLTKHGITWEYAISYGAPQGNEDEHYGYENYAFSWNLAAAFGLNLGSIPGSYFGRGPGQRFFFSQQRDESDLEEAKRQLDHQVYKTSLPGGNSFTQIASMSRTLHDAQQAEKKAGAPIYPRPLYVMGKGDDLFRNHRPEKWKNLKGFLFLEDVKERSADASLFDHCCLVGSSLPDCQDALITIIEHPEQAYADNRAPIDLESLYKGRHLTETNLGLYGSSEGSGLSLSRTYPYGLAAVDQKFSGPAGIIGISGKAGGTIEAGRTQDGKFRAAAYGTAGLGLDSSKPLGINLGLRGGLEAYYASTDHYLEWTPSLQGQMGAYFTFIKVWGFGVEALSPNLLSRSDTSHPEVRVTIQGRFRGLFDH